MFGFVSHELVVSRCSEFVNVSFDMSFTVTNKLISSVTSTVAKQNEHIICAYLRY